MKPESILQTDLLDIVFNNRNKDYGAYSLRKYYNGRLFKAMSVTFGMACLLSLSWYMQANYFKSKFSLIAGEPVTEVHLKSVDEPKKPDEPKIKKPVVKKIAAQVANVTIKIVPDNKADKQVPEVKELSTKLISSVTADGVIDDGIPASSPSEGDKNGSVIEQKKQEAAEEMKPLVNAEIMPEFPGGAEAFKKFMLRNLHEPEDLQEGEKVVVLIKFIVEADGSIVHAEVLQSGGRYDNEVLRVVKKMPRWKPGMQNGKFVPVYFSLPVTFTGLEN